MRAVRFVELVECGAQLLSVPTVDPFVISSGTVNATRSVMVRVAVKNYAGHSFVGFGEAACLPPVTREDQPDTQKALEHVAPQLLGRRIDELDALVGFLELLLPHHPVARAGLEVAILDALAKVDGKPLHQFLSNNSAPSGIIETDITIPLLGAERMAALAKDWTQKGFKALKVKVGKDVDQGLKELAAMVAAAPNARFRPDANGALSVAEALAYASGAKKLSATLECFEQPCATLAELKQVADVLDTPVLADESVKTMADFDKLVADKAADGVNLKLSKMGGMLRARAVGLSARDKRLQIMVGGMLETRLGMTAATHLAASLGGVAFADLDTAWLLKDDPFVGGYTAKGCEYELPDGNGMAIGPKWKT